MGKTSKVFYLAFLIFFGTTFAQTDEWQVVPKKPIIKETITVANPVNSSKQLIEVIADSLDSVCGSLQFRINNANHWFPKDTGFMKKCIDRAVQKSLIGGPYYKGCKYYSRINSGSNLVKVEISFSYKFPRTQLPKILNEVDIKAVNIINSLITPDMSDYEKEKTIHDYLVKHTQYDYLNYQNNSIPDEAYTPYGILIKGVGVCEGYAQTVQLLANKVGLDCIVVEGTGNGEPHTWNIIKIGEEYYHLDATWDDPAGEDLLNYTYFNLDDSQISVDHVWDKNHYPQCKGTQYNFFVYHQLILQDMDEFRKLIKGAVKKRQTEIYVKIANYDKTLFQKEVKSLLFKVSDSISYSISYEYSCYDNFGIVDIKFYY